MEFLVGDKTLDRSFQTASNTTRLVVNFNQLSGDKKYSIVIRGKTIKGLGEPSKDNVIIETPAMGECKVKEQNRGTKSRKQLLCLVFFTPSWVFSNVLSICTCIFIFICRISFSFTEFVQRSELLPFALVGLWR